jgi:hypothetical protein
MIGRMAEKYSMLPSQVAMNATTYDLMVTDVLATYDQYQQSKSKGGLMDASLYKFTEEELKGMLRK